MCSILGQFSGNYNKDSFIRANQLMKHRGPDNSDIYFDSNCILGHNRLSIIDLDSLANQPFFSYDGNYVIVFNGEIYNYLEIKQELKKLGYQFRTNSDTEVLLNGFIEWKEKVLTKLNGMFSFVIYNTRNKEVFIARDRAGVKPLHYAIDKNQLIFSSEIGPIVSILDNKVTLDEESVDIYYTLGYIPAPKTIYREIKKFPQGKYAYYIDGEIEFFEYWKPTFSNDSVTENDAIDHVEELLIDSIKLRVRSDVPVGAFLSGGIDSSLVVAYMKQLGIDVETYTIGFEEKEYDESIFAQKVSEVIGTNHHVKILNKSDFESVDHIVSYFGEPFADASAIPTFFVSKFASKNATVVLSGDGGDELFMGYNNNKSYKLMEAYKKVPHFLRSFFEQVVLKVCKYDSMPLVEKFRLIKKLIDDNLDNVILTDIKKKSVISPSLRKDYHSYKIIAEEWIENNLSQQKIESDYEQIMYNDFYMQLPDKMLAKVDRMSMAHSIEIRNPFLDYRLIEYAFSMSPIVKMPKYETKYLLKKLSEKFYPKDFVYRSKSGFVPPIKYWINDETSQSVNNQDKYIDMVYKRFIERN